MIETLHLASGKFYHIYNRGNNSENIFIEEKNYDYFLKLWGKHISPIADTYAYCMLKNHFHALVKMKPFYDNSGNELNIQAEAKSPWQKGFSNFFNAYAKSINKAYERTGKLFEERFRRKEVSNNQYLLQLVYYIHANPQKHGFTDDFRGYPHSSYEHILNDNSTIVNTTELLNWFDEKKLFEMYHSNLHLKLKNENSIVFHDVD